MLRLALRRSKDGETGPGEIKLPEAPEIINRLRLIFCHEDLNPLCVIIAAEGGNQVFNAQGIALLFERAIATFRRAGFPSAAAAAYSLYCEVPSYIRELVDNQQICQEAIEFYIGRHPELHPDPR